MVRITETDHSGKKHIIYMAKNYKEAEEWIMATVDKGVEEGKLLSYDWKEVSC